MKKLLIILLLTLTTGIFSVTVNIAALKGPTGLSMVNLIHQNMELGRDTDVNYNIVSTPDLVTAGLLSGDYDIAALPTNLASIIYNKKPDYILAAVTGQGTLYVVSSREDIKTFSDLKGKIVYNIARTSSPGFLLNYLLQKNSLNPETDLDVDFTYDHVALAPMLIAGKVETGVLPEPLVTMVLLKNPKMQVVLDFQKEYANKTNSQNSYPLSCIVVKESFYKENPEIIKTFLEELEQSIEFVNKNPMEAGKMGEEVGLGVTGPLVTKALPRLNLGFISAKNAQKSLSDYYTVLYNSDPKSVGGKIPGSEFYLESK